MPKIVVIGGSAGSIAALKVILKGLPKDFPAAVLIVTHIGTWESILPTLLERCSAMPVRHASQGEPIAPGQVLVAPSDLHLTVAGSRERAFVQLSRGPKENHSRPAIDPLFRSAGTTYRRDAIAVLLSGFLDDGTVGLQAIKACGGIVVVQDPADADAPDMPASALAHASVDFVRRAADIAATLVQLAGHAAEGQAASETREEPELPAWMAVENRMLDEGVGMEELDRIGSRVPLTCPECGGAIWQVNHSKPLRYRCHTGHAFTARVLEALQGSELEEAMWAGVRALHEQEQLFLLMHRQSQAYRSGTRGKGEARDEYLLKAEQAREQGKLLRELITARQRIAAGEAE
jgi:two-component system chemotaxis response regulator CheB